MRLPQDLALVVRVTTVLEGVCRTLDPELGYHYGATVPALDSGEELRVVTDVPPQTARHEGYERAFRQMPPVTVTV